VRNEQSNSIIYNIDNRKEDDQNLRQKAVTKGCTDTNLVL